MAGKQRKAFLAAQWLFAALVVWAAVRTLEGEWRAAGDRLATLTLDWGWLAAATGLVLLTYLLLVQTWRAMLAAWGARLPFAQATQIWFVSNLGKYIPGKVWSIAAMSYMARLRSVSPLAAAGSSILVQVVTVAAGLSVVLATGVRSVETPAATVLMAAVLVGAVALAPRVIPQMARLAGRITGMDLTVPSPGTVPIVAAFARTAVAWVLYGVAFQWFVRGVLGSASGATSSYIAVYAASYIVGFLALFAPGGIVVREGALVAAMVRLELAGESDALVIAVASRLWLTLTELAPGFICMAFGKRPASDPTST